MARPTRIIDIHQHVAWHGKDDAAIVQNMDEQGIEKSVLLNWDIAPEEGNAWFEHVLNPEHASAKRFHPGSPLSDGVRAKRAFPDRFITAYCPHALDPHGIDHLQAAIDMYDVRLVGEWKCRVPLDDPRVIEFFRFCGTVSLAVLIHMDAPWLADAQTGRMTYSPAWYGGTADNLARCLAACPDTIVIGHGPGFWRYISADEADATTAYPTGPVVPGGRIVQLLEQYPNLRCDLSAGSGTKALARDKAHAKEFLLKYHERIFFGRDCFTGDLHECLQSLDLPVDVTENIYHRNAEKLLRL